MDDQRNDPGGGVRQGLQFYARCVRVAWRRSWDVANAWGPIAAVLAVYGAARLGGVELSLPGEYGAAIGTGLFILVTWLAVFLVQFVAAPPRLWARLEAELLLALMRRSASPSPSRPLPVSLPVSLPAAEPEAPVAALPAAAETPAPALAPVLAPSDPLPALREPAPRATPRPVLPTLDIRLHDQVYETTAVDAVGERLPPSRAYVARITNRGDKRLRRCQLFFAGPAHIQVVSGPFDLAPGAHRDLPVLRVIDESDEPHALLYFLDSESWAVADGQAAWLPEPGRFKVKVLSANAPDTALDVTLACSASTPLAWTLVEAMPEAEETAPVPAKAGRKQRRWAADVAVERSSGD